MDVKALLKSIKYNKKRNFMVLILAFILSGLGLGYAMLQQDLSINGKTKINSSSWDVHLDSNSISTVSGSIQPTVAPTVSGTNLNFSVRLENAGDFYAFTIDVVNDGTMDANLSGFTLTPVLSSDVSKYLTFTVTYDDNTPLTVGDVLAKNDSTTLKVLARYNNNLNVEEYPIIDETYNFTVQLDYAQ